MYKGVLRIISEALTRIADIIEVGKRARELEASKKGGGDGEEGGGGGEASQQVRNSAAISLRVWRPQPASCLGVC
eukprot:2747810-Rhodomonas_salina.3